MTTELIFARAFTTRSLRTFLKTVFPPEWAPIGARIAESGASMSADLCPWAPRWSPIPPTVRGDGESLESMVRSCVFRAHDCIHQLWGLPIPSHALNEEDFYTYKRSQMCGEVAVLTLTEFVLCKHLLEAHPAIRDILWSRDALAMLEGPLRGLSTAQVAARLDDVLHKKRRPRWVREHKPSSSFVDYYVPMLEEDRRQIDHNFGLMRAANWRPVGAPNSRYRPESDGLELTTWMVADFYHLMGTDPEIDEPLAKFNRERRSSIVLPAGWNEAPVGLAA